jgi:hypothetical protein
VARGLKLRHDHGSDYMSGDFQDEIECPGIEASPSFVREPEGKAHLPRCDRGVRPLRRSRSANAPSTMRSIPISRRFWLPLLDGPALTLT